MTKAEELAAKAARIRQQAEASKSAAASTTESRTSVPTDLSTSELSDGPSRREVKTPATPSVRVKPVRLTVDVSPADHAALLRWCLDAASDLGVARVSGQALIRAMLRQALSSATVRADITSEVGRLRETTE